MPTRGIKVAANEIVRDPRVLECNDTGRKCWNWSIFPIIALSCFIGVDLSQPSKSGQKWKTAFSFLSLIIHAALTAHASVIIHGQLYQMANIYFGEGGNHSRTFVWNIIIDFVNFEVGCFIIHWMLFFVVRKKWRTLNKAFQCLSPLFDDEFYHRLRRLSFAGVAHAVLWIICLSITGTITSVSANTPFTLKLLTVTGTLLQFYPTLGIVLFTTVSYASSLSFQSITSKLNCNGHLQACNLSNSDVIVLKRYYVSACQAVDIINDCFGWLLLLVVPHLFISEINVTFYWFGNLKKTASVSGFLFFVFQLVNIFVICISSDCIRVESDKVLKQLLRLRMKSENNTYRKQVHELILHLALTSPRISALGLFYVGKKLIPTMIGTTLTYYFILHQFRSLEEKP
ncbi:uncharacterized protein LOC130688983 [Daphnia carinata]|uniref:uncharacterized protein LOC130688983 n=1 Tax=Daphnia carinata TaxID=120202 RepID=UPI0028684DE4|nr:uncharacterized protein LOC130688983 [Daphnia carinata]